MRRVSFDLRDSPAVTSRRTGLLLALFLGAVALRPQIVGIGPLLPEIQDDLDMSHAAAGLLGTIPVLCMGAFAPPAPYLSGRAGTRLAIALSLALIGFFGLARAGAPGPVLLILLTLPLGVGIGFAGAIMPVAVKERFPDRPAFSTGVYTTGINVGSALALRARRTARGADGRLARGADRVLGRHGRAARALGVPDAPGAPP